MVLSMMAAQAGGVTLGVGVGGLLDIPELVKGEGGSDGCSGTFTYRAVTDVDAPDGVDLNGPVEVKDCKTPVRFGGQLVVPIRIHLGQLAVVRLTPGVQAISYNGSVSWASASGGTASYAGHTAAVIRPQLAVGGEFAFLATGVTPYIGAGVTVGANLDYHSLGPNKQGDHWQTTEAYTLRNQTAGETQHCNVEGETGGCKKDAENLSAGAGAELMFGVRTASADSVGFFAEASYNVLSLRAGRDPKNYGSVTLGRAKLNSVGLTAGIIIPLL